MGGALLAFYEHTRINPKPIGLPCIITDHISTVNHFTCKFLLQGNSQSDQFLLLRGIGDIDTLMSKQILRLGTRKAPIFSDTRKLCCNQPKIQTKMSNHSLRVFCLKDANGIANSDTDQTAPIGAA